MTGTGVDAGHQLESRSGMSGVMHAGVSHPGGGQELLPHPPVDAGPNGFTGRGGEHPTGPGVETVLRRRGPSL